MAKVPIVKLEDTESNLFMDISFNKCNGVAAVSFALLQPSFSLLLALVEILCHSKSSLPGLEAEKMLKLSVDCLRPFWHGRVAIVLSCFPLLRFSFFVPQSSVDPLCHDRTS